MEAAKNGPGPVLDIEAAYRSDPPPRPAWSAAIGNPAPLGLLAFGVTTFLLMSVDTLWSGKAFVGAVMGYAYAYGGLAQMLAGVLELLKGNTFAGTAFASYGSFWLSWAFFNTMARVQGAPHFDAADAGVRVGQCIMLAAWGVLTFGFFVPTLRKNACLMAVFGSLAVTFWLLAAGVYSPRASQAAGYVGAACGLSAIYTAFAEIYAETLGLRVPGLAPVRFI